MMPPFNLSPQVSLSDAPCEPQGGDQSLGVGSCLGTGPGASPYPVAIPGELVRPSTDSSWGAAVGRVRTLVRKRP